MSVNRKPHVIKAAAFRDQVHEQFPPAVIELPDGSTILFRVPLAQLDASTDEEFFERLREARSPKDVAFLLFEEAGQDPESQWGAYTAHGFTERDFMWTVREATAEYEDRLGKFRFSR